MTKFLIRIVAVPLVAASVVVIATGLILFGLAGILNSFDVD